MKVQKLFEEEKEYILYKIYNGKDSPTIKRKIFQEMPDKNGYESVFMPYGKDGKGFYYKKIEKQK
jgi:hypothetical protein